MTVAYESLTSNSVDPGTSIVLTKPSGVVNGWFLAVFGVHATGSANSLNNAHPAGWTQEIVTNNSEANIGFWTKIADNEGADWTWTWTTNNQAAFVVVAVSGNHLTLADAVNAEHYQAQTTTSIDIVNSVTPTVADCLLLFCGTRDTAAAETVTWSDSMPERLDESRTGTFLNLAVATQLVSAVQAYSRTLTFSASSRRNLAAMIAIRPPAAGGGEGKRRLSLLGAGH